jgi:hypothetical protein
LEAPDDIELVRWEHLRDHLVDAYLPSDCPGSAFVIAGQ